jgi:hypothetical protein
MINQLTSVVTIFKRAAVKDLEAALCSTGEASLVLVETGEQNLVVARYFTSQLTHVVFIRFFV